MPVTWVDGPENLDAVHDYSGPHSVADIMVFYYTEQCCRLPTVYIVSISQTRLLRTTSNPRSRYTPHQPHAVYPSWSCSYFAHHLDCRSRHL